MQATATTKVPQHTSMRGALLAGVAGNMLEWFDYSLYGFFASVISANFFPAKDPIVGLMITFLVFGLGFVARPVGGFLFGHYADRIGRKNVLAITVILMGGSTLIMGLLPSYARIGVAAPIILTFARLLQGTAAGGEFGSCVSFLAEYATPRNRAFIVSWSQVSAAAGLLLGALWGTALSSLLSQPQLYSWGWRIAFIFGIVVALAGYIIRKNVDETPVFQQKTESDALSQTPLVDAFRNYKKELITVFFLVGGSNVTYWLVLNFMSTYISRFLKLGMTTGFSLTVVTLVAFMAGVPLAGHLADRFGRKPLMLAGSGGLTFLGYPLFKALARTSSYGEMAGIVIVLALIFSLYIGGFTVGISELFPTNVRCSGFSMAYQVSSAVFGGTAMATVTWLIRASGSNMAVPMYMSGLMFVCLLATVFLFPETKDRPLG